MGISAVQGGAACLYSASTAAPPREPTPHLSSRNSLHDPLMAASVRILVLPRIASDAYWRWCETRMLARSGAVSWAGNCAVAQRIGSRHSPGQGLCWSSLKEWSRSRPSLGVLIFLFGFSARFWARRVEALGSRIGPWADRVAAGVLDADAGRRMLFTAEKWGVCSWGWPLILAGFVDRVVCIPLRRVALAFG
jgi:hypothetical protein